MPGEDLTNKFGEIVADLGGKNGISKESDSLADGKSSFFNEKLSELVASITYMRDFLIENKKDYINIYNSMFSMASSMTDEERNRIDKDVQDFVKVSYDVIKMLRAKLKSAKSKQQYEHENNAIIFAENYIKLIHDFHNKQKALRLRRNLDSQTFFRLSKSIKGADAVPNSATNKSPTQNRPKERLENDSNRKKRSTSINSNSNYLSAMDDEVKPDDVVTHGHGLSVEEMKMFKDEGIRMYEEMNSMNDEVRSIGQKLSEIAKLQEAFSESVSKQEMDLNNLNSTTITSTESIREGNEQLRAAMRKNAGFRVCILFFITTLAFVVLFLDWYNG